MIEKLAAMVQVYRAMHPDTQARLRRWEDLNVGDERGLGTADWPGWKEFGLDPYAGNDPPEPGYVYYLYDDEGTVLYVGVSKEWGTRLSQHAKKQPWWDEVRAVTVTKYDTREQANAAEIDAIRESRPRYNIDQNPDRLARWFAANRPVTR